MKTFNPLSPTSKLSICGLPLRMDTYRTCTFGCKYCFANGRTVMPTSPEFQVANLKWLNDKLNKILVLNKYNETSLLDMLIKDGYTFHCGGMSDPFQPAEQELQITKQAIDICNEYERHILFSTKSDNLYSANLKPELHTFQLSVSNIENRRDLEPNVPDIENRYKMFCNLKDKGFKVGIRIQPFIPNLASLSIVEKFKDADHFTLEGLKMVSTNKEQREYLIKTLNLNSKDFTALGLLIQRPTIRYELYKPFVKFFEENNMSYSIADNDLHWLGNNRCCCGDVLVNKSTNFNSTALAYEFGSNYTQDDLNSNLIKSGLKDCHCASYFNSAARHGCKTIQDFFDYNFNKKKSIFTPSYFWFPEVKA